MQTFNLNPITNSLMNPSASKQRMRGQSISSNEMRKKVQNYSFKLCDKIGKGYSSTVYKGQNDLTRETVAIKVIQLRSLKDNVTRSLLDTQIQCLKELSRINSPYLLKYHDSYITVNNCYIMTEYCDGGDLAQQLRKKGKYSEYEVMNIFYQLHQGFKSMFETGFIHRDLKPANIFIKDGKLKIADFGFVKRTLQNPKQSYNVGTPIYMSPEAMFHNIYSEKSDIWSLGVICYELIHGKVPWKGLHQKQIRTEIHKAVVSYENTLLSEQMKDFIKCCMMPILTNRIKVKDLRNHPWVQKIYTMKQPFFNQLQQNSIQPQVNLLRETMRNLPYLDLKIKQSQRLTNSSNQEINVKEVSTQKRGDSVPQQTYHKQIKENDINYTNLAVTRKLGEQKHNPRTQSVEAIFEKKKTSKSLLDNLIIILNYVRFLYRIYGILKDFKQKYTCNQNINEISSNEMIQKITQQVIFCMEKHQEMIQKQQNIFGLECPQSQWKRFVKNSKFKVYKGVIKQYATKYQSLKQNPSEIRRDGQKLNMPLSVFLRQRIVNLYRQIDNQYNFDGSRFKRLEIIDYLVSLYEMNRMVNEQGWKYFVIKSNANQVVEGKSLVDQWNYQRVYAECETKLRSLQII